MERLDLDYEKGWILRRGDGITILHTHEDVEALAAIRKMGFFNIAREATTIFETASNLPKIFWMLEPASPFTTTTLRTSQPHHDHEFLIKNGARSDLQLVIDGKQFGFVPGSSNTSKLVSRDDFPEKRHFVFT